MRLKFPKSNVAWEVRDNDHSYSGSGSVAIRASLDVPGVGLCCSEQVIDRFLLEDAFSNGASDRLVEVVLRNLEREVGKRMVRG